MAGRDSFLFEEPVGILGGPGTHEFREPVTVFVEMVQNGFKLRYENKKFVAKTLDEAMKMIRKWFEDKMGDKEEKSEHKESAHELT